MLTWSASKVKRQEAAERMQPSNKEVHATNVSHPEQPLPVEALNWNRQTASFLRQFDDLIQDVDIPEFLTEYKGEQTFPETVSS